MTETKVPTYSLAERDRRWALARTFLEREGLDALIVFGEHEDNGSAPFYFDTWFTNDRPGSTIVFLPTGEPIALGAFVSDDQTASVNPDADWLSRENLRMGRDAGTTSKHISPMSISSRLARHWHASWPRSATRRSRLCGTQRLSETQWSRQW
jgi:hypothetical protein